MRKKILIVAAHPDDEVLGCGGTAARLAKEGGVIHTLVLGEGITSRMLRREDAAHKITIAALKREALRANKALGIQAVNFANFPDNKFDSVPLLDIVKCIEKVKRDFKPDVIFTHYENDLNIDHRLTYKAVVTATRPMYNESVREVYSFEILSSTEWGFPLSFSPDVFWDISATVQSKVNAMKQYKSELAAFPHPRSLKGIILSAEYWGMRVGLKNAEAFKLVRLLK